MARGARKGPELLSLDMRAQKIQNLGRSTEDDGAARIDDIADLVSLPKPLGTAFPGVKKIASPSDHVHEGSNPAVEGATLYPSLIPDLLIRPSVRCLSAQGLGYGLNLVDLWTQIGGVSTWSKDATDPVLGYVDGGAGNIALSAGDFFGVVNETSSFPGQEKYSGIYELLIQGDGDTVSAVIRRVAEANTPAGLCSGMTYRVTGVGVAFEGEYFTVTTADPIAPDVTALTVTHAGTYASTLAYELLTGAQLVTEGADNTSTLEQSWTLGGGAGDAGAPEPFVTILGTPGVSSIPALPWTFDNEEVYLDAVPSCVVTLKVNVRDQDDGGAIVFTAESPPITNTAPAPLSFQGGLSVAAPWSPSHRLSAEYVLHKAGSGTVTIHHRYSSPTRSTRITVPFEMVSGLSGTTDHTKLTNRDAADQHPWSSIEPVGMATVPFPNASLVIADSGGNSGKLALGASNRYLVDPATLNLTQIQTPTVAAGVTVEIMLMFTAPVLVVPNVTPDTGYTALYIAEDASVTGQELENEYSSMTFLYVAALSAFVKTGEMVL
jgi:hypothetical protein